MVVGLEWAAVPSSTQPQPWACHSLHPDGGGAGGAWASAARVRGCTLVGRGSERHGGRAGGGGGVEGGRAHAAVPPVPHTDNELWGGWVAGLAACSCAGARCCRSPACAPPTLVECTTRARRVCRCDAPTAASGPELPCPAAAAACAGAWFAPQEQQLGCAHELHVVPLVPSGSMRPRRSLGCPAARASLVVLDTRTCLARACGGARARAARCARWRQSRCSTTACRAPTMTRRSASCEEECAQGGAWPSARRRR